MMKRQTKSAGIFFLSLFHRFTIGDLSRRFTSLGLLGFILIVMMHKYKKLCIVLILKTCTFQLCTLCSKSPFLVLTSCHYWAKNSPATLFTVKPYFTCSKRIFFRSLTSRHLLNMYLPIFFKKNSYNIHTALVSIS